MPPRLVDVLEIVRLLIVHLAEHALAQDFRETDDRVEGCPQLVRHVREELRLVAVGGLELALRRHELRGALRHLRFQPSALLLDQLALLALVLDAQALLRELLLREIRPQLPHAEPEADGKHDAAQRGADMTRVYGPIVARQQVQLREASDGQTRSEAGDRDEQVQRQRMAANQDENQQGDYQRHADRSENVEHVEMLAKRRRQDKYDRQHQELEIRVHLETQVYPGEVFARIEIGTQKLAQSVAAEEQRHP